jgi:hypothetical protein
MLGQFTLTYRHVCDMARPSHQLYLVQYKVVSVYIQYVNFMNALHEEKATYYH